MKRVWEVCGAGRSLPWNQSKGEQFLSWDVSAFPSYTNSGLSCPVSQIQMLLFPLLRWLQQEGMLCVSESSPVHGWTMQGSRILNMSFQTSKQGISDVCSLCVVFERQNQGKMCLSFLALSAWIFAFYPRSSEMWCLSLDNLIVLINLIGFLSTGFCWVGQKVHVDFSITCNRKTRVNFWVNLIKWAKKLSTF